MCLIMKSTFSWKVAVNKRWMFPSWPFIKTWLILLTKTCSNLQFYITVNPLVFCRYISQVLFLKMKLLQNSECNQVIWFKVNYPSKIFSTHCEFWQLSVWPIGGRRWRSFTGNRCLKSTMCENWVNDQILHCKYFDKVSKLYFIIINKKLLQFCVSFCLQLCGVTKYWNVPNLHRWCWYIVGLLYRNRFNMKKKGNWKNLQLTDIYFVRNKVMCI